jgi:hypothetical protein
VRSGGCYCASHRRVGWVAQEAGGWG